MICRYSHLDLWKADHFLGGRKITAIMPTRHEAWQALIEIVAIEAKQ